MTFIDYKTADQRLLRKANTEDYFDIDVKSLALIALAVIALADVFCYFVWFYSGQVPMGDFYFGMLTAKIINLFI